MEDAKIELVRSWLLKVDHDLKEARVLTSGRSDLRDVAIYHCQQSAEKSLKGFWPIATCRFKRPTTFLSC